MDIKSEIKLFCCSAVEDEPFREKLQKHLQILQKYGLINSLWSSQDITPGKEVDQETRRHVNTSQMILLLVSPDFLSSEVCYKIAIQAMERQKKGVHVIPIILRPVYWKDAPFGKLKVLPTNENPITSWANEDAALFDVAAGIRQTIVDWTRETSSNILIKMENVVPNALTASSFALVRTLVEHLGPVASVAFSSDGQLLLSDSWDNTIKIWNQDARSVLYTLKGHAGPAYSVGFSPDMRTIVSGSDDCTVKIWEARTGHEWGVLTGHSGPVSSVALSADSMFLVSGSYDKTIRVWEMATGKVLRTLHGHTEPVSSIALSPDGKSLVSGSHDKTLKVWEIATGALLEELTGHTEAVLSVAFHPDGHIIASGSFDKTIKIWQKAPTKNYSKAVSSVVQPVQHSALYLMNDIEELVRLLHLDLASYFSIPRKENVEIMSILYDDIAHMLDDNVIEEVRFVIKRQSKNRTNKGRSYLYIANYTIAISEDNQNEAQIAGGLLAPPANLGPDVQFDLQISWKKPITEEQRHKVRPPICYFDWNRWATDTEVEEIIQNNYLIPYRVGALTGPCLVERKEFSTQMGFTPSLTRAMHRLKQHIRFIFSK